MRPSNFTIYALLFAAAGLAGGVLAFGAGDSTRDIGLDPEAAMVESPAEPSPASGLLSWAARPTFRWFPALFKPEIAAKAALGPAKMSQDPAPEPEESALPAPLDPHLPILANNQIIAFYGQPNSKWMGILGEYPKEELARLLEGYAKLYDDANGNVGVVPAFYLIYGTCWPGGEIGFLKSSLVTEYIEFARERGMVVFIDHQIGKYSVHDAVSRLLPFLRYPNVHLALDPEWRTTSPMVDLGGISAEELNEAQSMIQGFLDREGIPGVKMLVVHQFKEKMIESRERVRADFERVILVHTADGFGPPALKRGAYSYNARAKNMPLKGIKLFFKNEVPGAGYDEPLLAPEEVLGLDPPPALVIYQ